MTPWTVAHQVPLSWDSSGKNTGVSCHALLQGFSPTQGLNAGLLHCRLIVYQWSYEGSPVAKLPISNDENEVTVFQADAIPENPGTWLWIFYMYIYKYMYYQKLTILFTFYPSFSFFSININLLGLWSRNTCHSFLLSSLLARREGCG